MTSLMRSVAAAALFGLAAVASADSLTCSTLESTSNISIDRRFELDYTTENSEYWWVGPLLSFSRAPQQRSFSLLSTILYTYHWSHTADLFPQVDRLRCPQAGMHH